MHTELSQLCVRRSCTIRNAVGQIDGNKLGIVLVVDEERRLLGTVTDGDVRRALLERLSLEEPVAVILARKAATRYAKPITASLRADAAMCLRLLKEHNILHLPLLDDHDRVMGLVTRDEFLPAQPPPMRAVVMAGGVGRRLHPLTEETPKPMLRVGERPLLEIIIRQLREAGIKQVQVTTHHKPNKIAEHFGDGRDFGVELTCVEEHRPLGTAGGLALLTPPTETTLVINGDILTQVDFRAMLTYHLEHKADLTVGVRQYDVSVPYGVVECDGPAVRQLREKPVMNFFVNAGIYLFEPVVHRMIPRGQRYDMTDLIQGLLEEGRLVVSFPIREYWLDIGQQSDYEQAQEEVKTWKPRAAEGGTASMKEATGDVDR